MPDIATADDFAAGFLALQGHRPIDPLVKDRILAWILEMVKHGEPPPRFPETRPQEPR